MNTDSPDLLLKALIMKSNQQKQQQQQQSQIPSTMLNTQQSSPYENQLKNLQNSLPMSPFEQLDIQKSTISQSSSIPVAQMPIPTMLQNQNLSATQILNRDHLQMLLHQQQQQMKKQQLQHHLIEERLLQQSQPQNSQQNIPQQTQQQNIQQQQLQQQQQQQLLQQQIRQQQLQQQQFHQNQLQQQQIQHQMQQQQQKQSNNDYLYQSNLKNYSPPSPNEQHHSQATSLYSINSRGFQNQELPKQTQPKISTNDETTILTSSNYYPGTASLIEYIDKQLMIILRDGKKLIGYLRSIDQYANLLLSSTFERIYVNNKYADIQRGIYLIRGENVVLLGEVDMNMPLKVNLEQVSEMEIKELQSIEKKKQEEAEKSKKRSLLDRCLVPNTDLLDEYY